MRNLDGCGSLALEDGSQGVLIRPTKAMKVAEESGVACRPEQVAG